MGQYIMTHSVFKCLLHNNAGRSKGKGGDGGCGGTVGEREEWKKNKWIQY